MFVPVYGTTFDANRLKNTTLVLPSQSAGLSGFIGMELFCLNTDMERVGFYKSDFVAPVLMNDNMTLAGQVMG